MKKIKLGVTEFAVPAPRKGSIDVHSGFGRAPTTGLEIHQKLQSLRIKEFADYQAEVAIQWDFKTDKYCFDVNGRMDGFFNSDEPKIEEIKSSFNVYDLAKRLRESKSEHPYCLQLLTYGYIHWKKTKVIPKLILHLVSSRNGEGIDFELRLDIEFYEAWLARRLLELDEEAYRGEQRIKRRKKAAGNFIFPFDRPRAGQVELIQTIKDGMKENRPMLLQAPTGLGKTIGVLYPTLQESLERGQKVIYITPKNSQHSVAEEAIDRLQEQGAAIKGMTITAKSKMCFKNEPLCNPDYCEYAKDHYTKVAENKLLETLAKKRRLKASIFKKMGTEFQVCPFELQLDAAADVDAVICDYNYVFAPRAAFGRLTHSGLGTEGKPNLVIDEVHNLPSRAMDYYSPSLSVFSLEKMRDEIDLIPKRFREPALELLNNSIETVKKCAPQGIKAAVKINPPVDVFISHDIELRGFLSAYLAADTDIQPGDPIMRLCFYWSEFTAALEFVTAGHKEFFTTFHPNPARLQITCCDASEMLKDSYKDYAQVVGFSATLKPFEFYSQLSGLKRSDLKTAEFISPFPKENRKLLIIPQISSKFSERVKNYPRIAETIKKIIELKNGNYVAFFPSFDFMEKVLEQMPSVFGFQYLRQHRNMQKAVIEDILETLKSPAASHVLFAVQGGVFSEGVDYPGDMLIGAFVVGPPLPNFDLQREKMREYYQENYQSGFDYAYTFPAMAKAIQAAGRVIRSEKDRGLIVLMDDRFMQSSYTKSMPQDWFEQGPQEAVSKEILKDITKFWNSVEIADSSFSGN